VVVFCTNRLHHELLEHNPHIDVLTTTESFRPVELLHRLVWAIRGPRQQAQQRFKLPAYARHFPMLLTNKHATEIIADMLNVTLADRKLEVFLTKEEEASAKTFLNSYETPVAIHVTSNCCDSQNWSSLKWESLVQRNPRLTFLQLGSSEEVRISGTVDLRGRTTLRESIALLKHVRSFVGVVSSMAHATNAVGTPAVVLFGPSAPEVWAHPNIEVITKNLRCAPCVDFLVGSKCPYGAPCLSDITVQDVEGALFRQMDKRTRVT
jgi:ADP-heptose:LPS heptosyltransferase